MVLNYEAERRTRPAMRDQGLEEAIRAAGLDPWATVVCVRPTPDISGSALRRAIANGEDVTDRLPGGVATYIAKNTLYMDNR